IGAVEFDAGGGASHCKVTVAAEDRVFVLGHGERPGEGFEVFGGVVVAGASYGDVLVDDGLFFFAELLSDDAFESGKAYAHHAESGTHGECVLRDFISRDVGEFGDWDGAELDAGGGR